jgi:hypothetical protein
MMLTRRSLAVGSAALATTTLAIGPDAVAAGQPRRHPSPETGQVVLDWQRVSMRTIFTNAAVAPPIGTPVLGFVSLAVHRAVCESGRRRQSSATAAVAQAAHDVLAHYYPAFAALLDADLAATLAPVTSPVARAQGVRIGAYAAAEMIASRVGDHYLDASIVYAKPPGPGVWQLNPGTTNMVAAWLGSLTPLVLDQVVTVGGPDPLTSSSYAMDYNEVKAYGRATSTTRTQAMTDTAQFFNSNGATMVSDALVRYLESHPLTLEQTALMFAQIHGAMTDSAISCWGQKRDVGFWRPSQAISGQYDDGNPDTTPEPGWTPLVPNPNYSDYVSGHASLNAPAVEVIRRWLGETTPLELRSGNSPTPRVYGHLYELEHEAFNARIWSGLHFRRAMVDGYEIGHRTAERVMATLAE